ncbi:MAG TPA: hypothetical protein VN238_10245 [Solirubrobacteraceae bacterium]|nr:hypothetical protein [Solirubrobacteraceae bacterium]
MSDTRAGGHPNVEIATTLTDPGESLRDVVVRLPRGLVGNPAATAAKCTAEQFAAYACPAASKVGETDASTNLGFLGTADGDVFNLVPREGEPARLGLALNARFIGIGIDKLPLEAAISLAPDDQSLVTTIRDIPDSAGGIPITVTGLSLTLNGVAPSGRPFLTNPTTCTPAVTTMTVTSRAETSGSATDEFDPTACDAVPFDPGAGVDMASTAARTPTGATVRLTVPGEETPVRQSYVRRASVVLPEGVTLNAPLGAGLETCPDGAASCPEAAKIGSATVETPLVGSLSGDVFLAEPRADDPYRLVVALAGSGVNLVLRGSVAVDQATGRLTTTFDDLPQVPFTSFALTFRGGDRAVLRQSDRCGEQQVSATLTPWSGGAERTAVASYTVGECADTLTPGFGVSASTSQAGASPSVDIAIERPDRQPGLRELTMTMPSGLLGKLTTVAPGDRVGSVTVTAGAGGAPLTLDGSITFAAGGPGELGALVVRVPAKVGPFDLGVVELRSGLRLGDDGRLRVSASGLPSILGGIPLEVRRMVLRLDKPGFMLNPSACGTPKVEAVINGVATSAPYPVTGCERLAFGPRLTTQVSGGRAAARKGGTPALTTTIVQPEGEAAMKRASVILPNVLGANLAALGAVCGAADPAACPASATVGSAEARTPLLAEPLRGPVVLVKGSGALPKMVVLLRGQIPLRLDADVALDDKGRVVATFGGLPDVPVTRFVLQLNGGPGGMLQSGADLCGVAANFAGSFTSWAGGSAESGARGVVDGCGTAPAVKVSLSRVGKKGPQLVVKVTRGPRGAALSGVTVTLPSQLRGRAKALVRVNGKGRSTRAGSTFSATAVRVSRKATKSLELRLPAGTLAPTKALRTALSKGKMPSLDLVVDVRTADKDTWTTTWPVKARRATPAGKKQQR